MKIGVISDIHGNAAALRHALTLLSGVSEIVCLGDAIDEFEFSDEVVGLLRQNGVETITGNHEQVFFSPAGARARSKPGLDSQLLEWLSSRPQRKLLQRGSLELLLVHSTPWDSGHAYIGPSDARLEWFARAGADFVFYGHTHEPVVRKIDNCIVVNPGSLGQARLLGGRLVQSMAIVDLQQRWAEIVVFPEQRRVGEQGL